MLILDVLIQRPVTPICLPTPGEIALVVLLDLPVLPPVSFWLPRVVVNRFIRRFDSALDGHLRGFLLEFGVLVLEIIKMLLQDGVLLMQLLKHLAAHEEGEIGLAVVEILLVH